MAREPSYPADASVGSGASEPASSPPPAPSTPSAGGAEDGRRRKQLMTGAAIGIGSAALVAALLYANRGKKGDRT